MASEDQGEKITEKDSRRKPQTEKPENDTLFPQVTDRLHGGLLSKNQYPIQSPARSRRPVSKRFAAWNFQEKRNHFP